MRCCGRGQSTSNQPTPGCCSTLLSEWSPCGDYFFVHDPVTDRILDIPESFAPLNPFAIVGKLVMGCVTFGTMAYVILKREHRDFMFVYLTYWAIALQCFYHILSIFNSLLASAIEQPRYYVQGRVRLTWLLFNLSMGASIIAAILWWGFLFEPGQKLDYEELGPHGATLVAQYIDGFWINRIPIRFRHYWVTLLPLCLAYSLWTFLQGFIFDIENPDRSEEEEQDIMYEDVDWDNDLMKTILIIVIVVFAVAPVVQSILFLLSLYHIPCFCMLDRRWYLDSGNDEERARRRNEEVDSLGDVYRTY